MLVPAGKAWIDARWPAACASLQRSGFPTDLTHLGPRCLADDVLWRDAARCALLRSPLSGRHSMDDAGAVAAAMGLCSAAEAKEIGGGGKFSGVAARATLIIGATETLREPGPATDGRASDEWLGSIASSSGLVFATHCRLPTARVVSGGRRVNGSDTKGGSKGENSRGQKGAPSRAELLVRLRERKAEAASASGEGSLDAWLDLLPVKGHPALDELGQALSRLNNDTARFSEAFDTTARPWVDGSRAPATYGAGPAAQRLVPLLAELRAMLRGAAECRETESGQDRPVYNTGNVGDLDALATAERDLATAVRLEKARAKGQQRHGHQSQAV